LLAVGRGTSVDGSGAVVPDEVVWAGFTAAEFTAAEFPAARVAAPSTTGSTGTTAPGGAVDGWVALSAGT